MLREITTKQTPNEPPRRWMTDDYFDLIVWFEADGSIYGFQLCYDKAGNERALTWTPRQGFSHRSVDSGEDSAVANEAPTLTNRCEWQDHPVQEEFIRRSLNLSVEIKYFVLVKIQEFTSQESRS